MSQHRTTARAVAALICIGGVCLGRAERLLCLRSGTLAAARASVGEQPSEIAAWRLATDHLLARAETDTRGRS